jgi:hypothetical protein
MLQKKALNLLLLLHGFRRHLKTQIRILLKETREIRLNVSRIPKDSQIILPDLSLMKEGEKDCPNNSGSSVLNVKTEAKDQKECLLKKEVETERNAKNKEEIRSRMFLRMNLTD